MCVILTPLKLQQLQHPAFLRVFSDSALNVHFVVSRVPYFPIGPKPKCCPKKTKCMVSQVRLISSL